MDYVAANEGSVLLALNPSKLWSREFIQKKLDEVIAELEDIGVVRLMAFRPIISLTGNVQRLSLIHEKAFNVLYRNGVNC
uniref:Uncharacterized protein n=1 Tax=Arundo donax TaxID=35708 RepID=A0A0A8ZTI2_ARUDO